MLRAPAVGRGACGVPTQPGHVPCYSPAIDPAAFDEVRCRNLKRINRVPPCWRDSLPPIALRHHARAKRRRQLGGPELRIPSRPIDGLARATMGWRCVARLEGGGEVGPGYFWIDGDCRIISGWRLPFAARVFDVLECDSGPSQGLRCFHPVGVCCAVVVLSLSMSLKPL